MFRKTLATTLSFLLAWLPVSTGLAQGTAQQRLDAITEQSYLRLVESPPSPPLRRDEVEAFKDTLKRREDTEKDRLEQEEEQLEKRAKAMRNRLEELNKSASRDDATMAEQRRELHCSILKVESELRQKRAEREQGLPLAYDNKRAKLDLALEWPARKREIDQMIAAGRARLREHGNVEDIGIRVVGEDQEKDIKTGEEALRELKAYGLLPPELENEAVSSYIQELARTIAANSDLRIPVRVTVLESEEINAFALPGGFLFVNSGLIQKAETESELVGVMAHEIAHASARHGARLMKRATIAGIFYQVAQLAALIFTGGAVGIGAYYALQYGFFGLGMVLNLTLLGVSRDFESEADQLGAQYAWKSGYDPRGFITFFDKMASEKGYVKSASFFRTHPPFFDRMLDTFSEIAYLPAKPELQVDSTAFQKARAQVTKIMEEAAREPKKRPTLRRLPECGDDPPA